MAGISVSKKIMFWVLYVLYLLAVIFAVDYSFYFFYKKKIIPSDLSEDGRSGLEMKAGHLVDDKISSFTNFAEKKADRIIRIGCFGDSFTHGDEVNNIYDYPSILQGLLNKNGYGNIEVINFGNPGHGFSQAFLVWGHIGKKYDLDYILLGPQCFQHERDSTFGAFGFNNYIDRDIHQFHQRFILKGNDAQLVDLVGETKVEIINNYFRFIPPLRYILFDSEAPSFLAAPVACLLPERKFVKNPFYYNQSIEKEMTEIYEKLLVKIGDDVPQVILGHYEKSIVDLGRGLKNNIFSVLFVRQELFPYQAFGQHNSPNGNELVAKQFFDCLTNRPESKLAILQTKNIDENLTRSIEVKKNKLSEYKEIAIEVNNIKVGRFYNLNLDPGDVCQPPSCEPKPNTGALSKVVSLLVFKNDSMSILDSMFLPLSFEIEDGMPLRIRIVRDGGVVEYALGSINLLNPGLNVGMVDLGDPAYQPERKAIEFEGINSLIKENNFHPNKIKQIIISLKDVRILVFASKGFKNEGFKFTPVNGEFIIICADGRELLDVEALKPEGEIYLSLYSGQQEKTENIPIARWHKVFKNIPLQEKGRSHFLMSSWNSVEFDPASMGLIVEEEFAFAMVHQEA